MRAIFPPLLVQHHLTFTVGIPIIHVESGIWGIQKQQQHAAVTQNQVVLKNTKKTQSLHKNGHLFNISCKSKFHPKHYNNGSESKSILYVLYMSLSQERAGNKAKLLSQVINHVLCKLLPPECKGSMYQIDQKSNFVLGIHRLKFPQKFLKHQLYPLQSHYR